MKKLFAIVALGLLWSTYAYAVKFEKCYEVPFDGYLPKELTTIYLDGRKNIETVDGKTTNDYILEYFLKYNKPYDKNLFEKGNFETEQYVLFVKNKVIQFTRVITDEAWIRSKKTWDKFGIGKITQINYPIIHFTENYIEAGNSRAGYVKLNLKKNMVISSPKSNYSQTLSLSHCKTNSSNKNKGTFKSILGNVIGK